MNKSLKVIHVYPAKGGVAVYAKVVSSIYKQQNILVEDIVVSNRADIAGVLRKLNANVDCIYHFEIGAGDSAVFAIARKALKSFPARHITTVHDTGEFVRHPLDNRFAYSDSSYVRLAGKLIRKALSITTGGFIRARYLASKKVTTVYLRKDLAEITGAEYLPQSVYAQGALSVRQKTKKPEVIGYSGYWGLGKGLETVVEAWKMHNFSNFRLIVSGGTAERDDSYSAGMRAALRALDPQPELPGFVDDIDAFLLSLSVLLLPYWPELPSGTSAMALRAAELGVPIIASSTPALKEQLGEGPIYIEPKNAEALVSALKSLEKNWNTIQENASQLSTRINSDHSWKTVGKRLSEIIERANA